jgi:hypothetical protein
MAYITGRGLGIVCNTLRMLVLSRFLSETPSKVHEDNEKLILV